ncbi:membrane-spanning 4-domains subfamily A member 8 isoform X1 [Amia ocellicauda]|uniref:membrane-spanning 4-domains subfamily A member 8 isoform X1 n=1 Tax=Amia ocellicauda TaxID=2972642 RepID=UPI0034642C2D
MSASVTTEGDMVIITQVYPQTQGSMPSSAPLAQSGLPHGYTSPGSAAWKRFVKGEPTALGVVQIMIGLFNVGSGVLVEREMDSIGFHIGLPFWPSLIYIISGALSIAGEKQKKTACLGNPYTPLNMVLLTLAFLEFCVAISVAVFGCKAVCITDTGPVIVIQYGASPQPATQPSSAPSHQPVPDREWSSQPHPSAGHRVTEP